MRKELDTLPDKLVLNANVLDYFLENMKVVPKEWRGEKIFFWGTIYRASSGNLFVAFLYWIGVGWDYDYMWLDASIAGPAAVLDLI